MWGFSPVDSTPPTMATVHISLFEFETDQQYYLEEDRARLELVRRLKGIVGRAQVVDSVPRGF